MLPNEFFEPFVAMCSRLRCDPIDLLAVAANESGLNPRAYNPKGAAGLWQMTPTAAPGMGWDPHNVEAFRNVSAVDQLPYWERYFAPKRGKLVNAAACYVCTYLPALLHLASNPQALLCSANGQSDGPPEICKPVRVIGWYVDNKTLDRNHDGRITVQDLTDAIDAATNRLGATWQLAVQGVLAAMPAKGDEPIDVTDGGRNRPVPIIPDPYDDPPPSAA